MLLPEVVSLADHYAAALVDATEMLESMGLIVENFGTGAVVVRAIPALLGTPMSNSSYLILLKNWLSLAVVPALRTELIMFWQPYHAMVQCEQAGP